jgi:DNA-binding NarL/FixJ family response regulator
MAWAQTVVLEGQNLTAREGQVVSMLAGGRTRKEVAYALGIAHSTVRVLYSRAVKKLEQSDRPTDRPMDRPMIDERPAPVVRVDHT